LKFILTLLGLCLSLHALAHEGHDHSAPEPVAVQSLSARGSASSELFEAVAVLEQEHLFVYLDRYASNEPVQGAKLEYEGDGLIQMAKEEAIGMYVVELASAPVARLNFTLSIEAGGDFDLLALQINPNLASAAPARPANARWMVWTAGALGALMLGGALWSVHRRRALTQGTPRQLGLGASVALLAAMSLAHSEASAHGDEDHDHAPEPPVAQGPGGQNSGAQRLSDGSLLVPKPMQRQLGIRTVLLKHETLARSVVLSGQVIADPNSAGHIQAVQAGIILPGPQGMPRAGQKVAQGEVLAYLRPADSTIKRANRQAKLAELEALLTLAEARVTRYLALEGSIPAKDLQAAEVDRAALKLRRKAISTSVNQDIALYSPVDGVVGLSEVVAGEVVDRKDSLFEIFDPQRLNVLALAYDLALAGSISSASARTFGAGTSGAGTEVALELQFLGGAGQLQGQALPLLFKIDTPDPAVAVGQSVEVIVRSGLQVKAIALPRAALYQAGASSNRVWVHSEPERFTARSIKIQPLDAERVMVVEGLSAADRVVVAGASLLSQAAGSQ